MTNLQSKLIPSGGAFSFIIINIKHYSIFFDQQDIPVFVLSSVKALSFVNYFEGPYFKASRWRNKYVQAEHHQVAALSGSRFNWPGQLKSVTLETNSTDDFIPADQKQGLINLYTAAEKPLPSSPQLQFPPVIGPSTCKQKKKSSYKAPSSPDVYVSCPYFSLFP